jgi:hypothetical protein
MGSHGVVTTRPIVYRCTSTLTVVVLIFKSTLTGEITTSKVLLWVPDAIDITVLVLLHIMKLW